MSVAAILMGAIAGLVGLVVVSYVVEALRHAPERATSLSWAPDIAIQYADLGRTKVRYIKTGVGPNIVLLHTLRTQLDLFERVVSELAKTFTVFALDYPGHGYSDIPKARYNANFFVRSVEGFLDVLDLRGVTLCGVSIGGSIALIVAGRRNSRVSRVVSINPYDYAAGRGLARSSPLGWMITATSRVPLVGETVMRLRNFLIMKAVLRGGVSDKESIRPALLKEMYEVGSRPGHYQAFLSLLRHSATWEEATAIYRNIEVPVLLIWGEQDWSGASEREHDRTLIPGAQVVTVEKGGHFLPLDRPRESIDLIVRFATG
jgi:pimeloyl-ACP methyl ester carboxylesterase